MRVMKVRAVHALQSLTHINHLRWLTLPFPDTTGLTQVERQVYSNHCTEVSALLRSEMEVWPKKSG